MKQKADLQEGPEAFERFKKAVSAVLTVPKSAVLEYEKAKRKKRTRRS